MKNLFIKVYGCQMNVYDANKLVDALSEQYKISEKLIDADLVILNTCHIREKAVMKLYSDLGRIGIIKQRANPKMEIAVVGCVAQIHKEELINRFPFVNYVLGTQAIHILPDLLKSHNSYATHDRSACVNVELLTAEKFDRFRSISNTQQTVSAFVTIQEGCDNFCTYCSVPYSRGREYSRSVTDVIAEVKLLAERGIKEVCLLGQNVNSYCYSDNAKIYRIEDLIYLISDITGINRIRYLSANPQNMSDALINAHSAIKQLMPSIHLPLQSGSNKILKKMNRPYTREEYANIVNKLKGLRNDISFTTDLIVGFPGETDKDFSDTLDIVKQLGFASGFYFKYSPRPSTLAANMTDQISEKEKEIRFTLLHELMMDMKIKFNKSFENKIERVLFEGPVRSSVGMYGRTEHGCSVITAFKPDMIGTIQNVMLTKAGLSNFEGSIV